MSFKDKIWDVHRLIWAVAELQNEDFSALKKNSDDFIVKVHQQRIYSVLCAAFNLEYDKENIYSVIRQFCEGYLSSDIDEPDFKLLIEKLSDGVSYSKEECEEIVKGRYRKFLFEQLMRERVKAEDFECRNNNIISGTKGCYLATKISDKLYSGMTESNRKLEDIIALLLGNKGKFSFTEEELIKSYNYPDTTDEELLNYLVDNM